MSKAYEDETRGMDTERKAGEPSPLFPLRPRTAMELQLQLTLDLMYAGGNNGNSAITPNGDTFVTTATAASTAHTLGKPG